MSERLINPRPSVASRAGRALLRQLGVHPNDREAARLDLAGRSALCIATNHGVLDVGVPTGVFGSELTVPYYALPRRRHAGRRREPAGRHRAGRAAVHEGGAPHAGRRPDARRRRTARRSSRDRCAIADVDFASYDLVYFAGGWGAAFDLGQSDELGARRQRGVRGRARARRHLPRTARARCAPGAPTASCW